MTRSLTATQLHELDLDQQSAIRDHLLTQLGPDAVAHAQELRYTPAGDDAPSLLEVRISAEVEHPDGTLEPAAWMCVLDAPTPPAWKRWHEVDLEELAGPIVAELVEAAPTTKRRRRRT